MTTISRSSQATSSTGYRIAGSCPGCGADVELDDDYLVASCTHCGSALRIIMPDGPPIYYVPCNASHTEARFRLDRHLRESQQPLSSAATRYSTRWYPYWKIDGFTLKSRNRLTIEFEGESAIDHQENEPIEIRQRELTLQPFSISLLACQSADGAPATLGMRVGQLPLRPLEYDNDSVISRCGSVDCTASEAISRAHKSARAISHIADAPFGNNETLLFHPRLSLIYFPIIEARVGERAARETIASIDGVALHVHSIAEREKKIDSTPSTPHPEGEIRIESHRCRNCGDDFPPTKTFAHICQNCGWHYLGANISSHGRIIVVGSPDGKAMIPFWRLSTDSSGSDKVPLYVPAFGGQRFEQVYRVSRRASYVIPRFTGETDATIGLKTYPATVGPETAAAVAEAIIYRAKHENTLGEFENLPVPEDFAPTRADLTYVPFVLSDYFYVDAITGDLSIERALLDSAR
jgi:DNA-directed RNA polymerase subunit RPC12/RpoP